LRLVFFFFSSRRRHTRSKRDWSSDVCSSDLVYSFADKEDAEALVDEEGKGEIMEPSDLDNHHWEANEEMMDHGDDHDDHDGHGDDDHDADDHDDEQEDDEE